MARNETHKQKMSRVARELGAAVRREAAGKWTRLRVGERDEKGRHAWKFQPGPNAGVRFLRVTHRAMDQSDNPVPLLLEHLEAGRWLDRLNDGPETSLVLDEGGRLEVRA